MPITTDWITDMIPKYQGQLRVYRSLSKDEWLVDIAVAGSFSVLHWEIVPKDSALYANAVKARRDLGQSFDSAWIDEGDDDV